MARPGNTSPSLLDPAAIARAESLGFAARLLVEGYMSGEHRSPYHGFAIEFAQHREYSHGDDTRHLDWKVLGRTDRYYIKQYEQETNFVAHLLVDGSSSMRYASGKLSKFDYARVMAACLAYLVLHQRDAVSLELFDRSVREQVPRTNNLASIHNIIHRLSAFEPNDGSSIAPVLHNLAVRLRRRGIVILISDLLDDEEAILDGIRHIRFGGSEVIVLQTLDPAEIDFPFRGVVEFEGLEQEGRITTRPDEIRKSYLAEFGAFRRRIVEGCERNGCHHLLVNTAHPWEEVLGGYLAFRRRVS